MVISLNIIATIHLLFGTKVSDVRQLAEAGKQIFVSIDCLEIFGCCLIYSQWSGSCSLQREH